MINDPIQFSLYDLHAKLSQDAAKDKTLVDLNYTKSCGIVSVKGFHIAKSVNLKLKSPGLNNIKIKDVEHLLKATLPNYVFVNKSRNFNGIQSQSIAFLREIRSYVDSYTKIDNERSRFYFFSPNKTVTSSEIHAYDDVELATIRFILKSAPMDIEILDYRDKMEFMD